LSFGLGFAEFFFEHALGRRFRLIMFYFIVQPIV